MRMSKSLFRISLFTCCMCLMTSSHASWTKVTCKQEYKLSESDEQLSCTRWDLINDQSNRIVPGYSEASVDRNSGSLFVNVGGGLTTRGDDNGGKASALFRETVQIYGDWQEWLPVQVNLTVSYAFEGHGISQLFARLRTYSQSNLEEDTRAGFRLRHNKREHARLVHDEEIGEIHVPFEGQYATHDTVTVSTTSFVHSSHPALDIRVDLFAYALPRLDFLEAVSTASIQSKAKVELVVLDNTIKTSPVFAFVNFPARY